MYININKKMSNNLKNISGGGLHYQPFIYFTNLETILVLTVVSSEPDSSKMELKNIGC